MTIRNFEHLAASVWDWKCFNGCFGKTRISMSDIDGVVERNSHFLFIETKGPDASLPLGQSLLLSRLSAKPGITCWVVWGHPGEAQFVQKFPEGPRVPYTTEELVADVTEWYKYADTHKAVS